MSVLMDVCGSTRKQSSQATWLDGAVSLAVCSKFQYQQKEENV
jgi:hypothetical protein